MQLINAPGKLILPFANAGAKNSIPVDSQIGIVAGAASLTDGFPPLTRTPLAAGGVPPSGLDVNGILYELSAIVRWANAGGGYIFDATFATDTDVDGYPKGARVLRSDGLGYWFNTVDANVTDPEANAVAAIAAGWVPDFTNGAAAVTMTNANVTLTPLQYGKPVIIISGILSANLNLIFPTGIVGEWTVINNTTGAYSVTCKTAAGTGVVVSSVQAVVGDGTNVYSAVNTALFAMLGAAQTFTKGQRGEYALLTDGATITADMALGNKFRVQLGGNRTLGIPANLVAGQEFEIDAYQDNTGGRTLAFAWAWQTPGGTAPTLSTAARAKDKLVGNVDVYAQSAVTISIAAPGVVSWTAHGLLAGQQVQLTTTGALPTGLAANTTYFVVPVDADHFQLAATQSGAAITTSGAQSGVHTMTAAAITYALVKGVA